MKQLSKLTIAVALLLVPTVVSGKECPHKLKYATAHVYNMVLQCFNHLNLNSLRMFNAPIVPHLGINQCVCITEKIRLEFECFEDYMKHVNEDPTGALLGKLSGDCIKEGAMGPDARRAYEQGASSDNSTKTAEPKPKYNEPNDASVKEPKKEETVNKNPLTWGDLINK